MGIGNLHYIIYHKMVDWMVAWHGMAQHVMTYTLLFILTDPGEWEWAIRVAAVRKIQLLREGLRYDLSLICL